MNNPGTLTRHELEQLIELYFEARLDRDDERSLARVLAYTDIDSPAIADARRAMGVEDTIFFPLTFFRCRRAATVSKPEFSTTILWFSIISKRATTSSESSIRITSSIFF